MVTPLMSHPQPSDIKFFFNPSIKNEGGSFLEVKIFGYFDPKVDLDQNSILKIHDFVVEILCRDDVCCVIPWMCTVLYLQFNVFTNIKLSDEIFFNTSKMNIIRSFFWNQKIWKFLTPKGFYTWTFFQKFIIFSNKSHTWCVVVRSLAVRSVYETYY